MSKIVNEVDLIALNPKLATDTTRDEYFFNPLVFEQLLPIVRSSTMDQIRYGIKNANATMLLGYVKPVVNARSLPSLFILDDSVQICHTKFLSSMQKHEVRAENYRLQGSAGDTKNIHSRAEVFNGLDYLDATFRITKMSVFLVGSRVRGLTLKYHTGIEKSHGICQDAPSHELVLDSKGEYISEALVQEGKLENGTVVITKIVLATSACKILDTSEPVIKAGPKADPKVEDDPDEEQGDKPIDTKPEPQPPVTFTNEKNHHFSIKTDGQWSLRGFFGCAHDKELIVLGVVWGKDIFVPVPTAPMQHTICRNFISLGEDLQKDIRRHVELPNREAFGENFMLGKIVKTTASPNEKSKSVFNAMSKIDIDWKIRSIGFASTDNKLRGLKVTYTNSQDVVHGTWSPETQVWLATLELDSFLVVAKLTAGGTEDGPDRYIDTIEFVCSDPRGQLPAWPFETSMLRYLGEKDKRVTEDVATVVEQAPKIGNLLWSVRGFYGEQNDGVITSLGVV